MPLTQDMGHIDKPDLEHNIAYQILNPNTNITISKPDTDIDHNSDIRNSSSEIAICTKPLLIVNQPAEQMWICDLAYIRYCSFSHT